MKIIPTWFACGRCFLINRKHRFSTNNHRSFIIFMKIKDEKAKTTHNPIRIRKWEKCVIPFRNGNSSKNEVTILRRIQLCENQILYFYAYTTYITYKHYATLFVAHFPLGRKQKFITNLKWSKRTKEKT